MLMRYRFTVQYKILTNDFMELVHFSDFYSDGQNDHNSRYLDDHAISCHDYSLFANYANCDAYRLESQHFNMHFSNSVNFGIFNCFFYLIVDFECYHCYPCY